MDGKKIPHCICAVSICNQPLANYKNGRFCSSHLGMREICGIIPCGQPVQEGRLTCGRQSHKDWHAKYLDRFSRLSFPGVQRVLRRQNDTATASGPTLHLALSDLEGTPGDQVAHTFRARTIYCLQTVQWACGCPIGWGKCYNSESSSQVLGILDKIWEEHPNSKPSILAYDDACNLLRHIQHTTRALWLTGYEAQLRQMSDTNYDSVVHVLMLLYKESVEERVEKKQRLLTDDFWRQVSDTN
ncbi:hypothetical protein R3P38DRAFT_3332071 [Favolaschia claudopus]|uniref:CxC6 like cysteine cluster associated with KDZ domain-containing protein n=1 Tax=Favolaschia claudopus TaxID=2862362 RepID=A0AAV9ZQJ6_9AGAR